MLSGTVCIYLHTLEPRLVLQLSNRKVTMWSSYIAHPNEAWTR
jgi:hypothetical protein